MALSFLDVEPNPAVLIFVWEGLIEQPVDRTRAIARCTTLHEPGGSLAGERTEPNVRFLAASLNRYCSFTAAGITVKP